MHGLQGAEAQGPKRERGPTGCREIIFLIIFIWEFAAVTTAFCKQTHTHFQQRPGCNCLYSEWFSLGSPHTVCIVGMFHRYTRAASETAYSMSRYLISISTYLTSAKKSTYSTAKSR